MSQRLFPWYMNINFSEDIEPKQLGKTNLLELEKIWEEHRNSIKKEEVTVRQMLEIFDGKTLEEIREYAGGYESPTFSYVRSLGFGGLVRPVDTASTQRQAGATTLNCCGWCKFAKAIFGCSYCNITASCALIPEASDLTFSTPCLVLNGDDELINSIVVRIKDELQYILARKEEVCSIIDLILTAKEHAGEIPCIPRLRPRNWFELKEEVVLFIPEFTGEFITGRIVDLGGNYLTVLADKKVHNETFHSGRGLSIDVLDHCLMKRWEYEYMKEHPDYLDIWLASDSDNSCRLREAQW